SPVFMVGQYFSKSSNSHRPRTGLAKLVLQRHADAQFSNTTLPSRTACPTLIPEPPEIGPSVPANVLEARYIYPIRPPTIVVFVFKTGHGTISTATEVMIPHVMAQFTAAASQSTFPHVRGRIHQYPCRVQGRGTQKDHIGQILVSL